MISKLNTTKGGDELITPREKEVLYLIAHEHSTQEIAKILYVSYETANTHRKHLMNKLGAQNTAGLIRLAFEKNILVVDEGTSD